MATRFCILVVCAVAACGGGKKDSTTPDESGDSDIPEGQETAEEAGGGDISPVDPSQISNEQMSEVNRLLDRRRPAVSRCLAFAIDNKDLPKNSRGKVTLQLAIAPNGTAAEVSILKATIESKSLNECVIGKVKEIVFPKLPKRYETTYTYGFEAL